ncbi:MAG: glycosyltransferase family 4 protein [Thermodesulfobacteriota bacterium]|nr:glycosyltransferase family 4 protein [Thermodesulfobacteriota bacterium]
MLLIFARISHHSKMDVLPVFRAVQRLFRDGVNPASLCLYLAGWMDEKDGFKKTLLDLAANIGLDLKIAVKPNEADKKGLFRACDLFLSPADNPQETFGLTVLEAGAFGCATVASDYNGYRDLIVPGETGELVPTIGPDQTGDVDDLAPVCFENHYHLLLTQQTVVEVPKLYRTLSRLLKDEDLRLKMGQAARRRVEDFFSWDHVVHAYTELWDRLWDKPVDAKKLREQTHPLHLPYSRVFSGHASQNFGPEITVRWTPAGQAVYREQDFVLVYETLKDKVPLEVEASSGSSSPTSRYS